MLLKDSKLKYGAVNAYEQIDICSLAIDMGCSFVARSFSGDAKQLVPIIKAAGKLLPDGSLGATIGVPLAEEIAVSALLTDCADVVAPARDIALDRLTGSRDAQAALSVAAVTGASFIREVATGVYESDMGLWAPDAATLLRRRRNLNAEHIRVFMNVVNIERSKSGLAWSSCSCRNRDGSILDGAVIAWNSSSL